MVFDNWSNNFIINYSTPIFNFKLLSIIEQFEKLFFQLINIQFYLHDPIQNGWSHTILQSMCVISIEIDYNTLNEYSKKKQILHFFYS